MNDSHNTRSSRRLSGDTVLFISALEQELEDFVSILPVEQRTMGPLNYSLFTDSSGQRVIGHVCGIGKVNAAASVSAFLSHPEYNVSYVVSVGTAGGLDKSLKTSDIVIGRDFIQHDFDLSSVFDDCELGQVPGMPLRFRTLPADMESMLPTGEGVYLGTIVSGDRFVEDGNTLARFNPMAVDMESAAMAQVCYKFGIPFLSIRVITDMADSDAPEDWSTLFRKLSKISSNYAHRVLSIYRPLTASV